MRVVLFGLSDWTLDAAEHPRALQDEAVFAQPTVVFIRASSTPRSAQGALLLRQFQERIYEVVALERVHAFVQVHMKYFRTHETCVAVGV